MSIIEWINNNNGFSMFILTLVYVIATILICVFNYRSAKATKNQIKESERQFIEQNRARIIPKIITLEASMICLSFHNIGKDIATNVSINVSEEWLKKLEKVKKENKNADRLRKLKETPLFLTVDQGITYGLWYPGDGTNDYEVLSEIDFEVEISYISNNINYKENYIIPLGAYSFLMDTDYSRVSKKKIKKLTDIEKGLKGIKTAINRLDVKNKMESE